MRFKAMSHVAIGVRDMERSVRFYRDVLGLRVTLDDPAENPDGMLQTTVGEDRGQSRHAVYLRWEDGPDATFIVLSEYRPPVGQAIALDHIGISHVSFWVDDLDGVHERLVAAGVPIFVTPHVGDSLAYGEPPGGKILTILFRDPDGILLQLDQRLP